MCIPLFLVSSYRQWLPCWRGFCLVIGVVMHAFPVRAYFAETHQAQTVSVSHWQVKQQFQFTQPVPVAAYTPAQAEIVRQSESPPSGLFESEEILPHPPAACHNEAQSAQRQRRCHLQWENERLQGSQGQVVRKNQSLVVKRGQANTVVLRDWRACVPHGECDGETFTYLGRLGSRPYHAMQLSYGHDAPSLVLINPHSSKLFSVHYGSEPTFLNHSRTLVVNLEKLNPPLAMLLTALNDDAPRLELHCLGTSTSARTLDIHFQRWLSDQAFVLHVAPKGDEAELKGDARASTAIIFARQSDGSWQQFTLEGLPLPYFTCRQRGRS